MMKSAYIIVLFVFLCAPLGMLQAQNDFAVLEKNVNVRAKGLIHKLNVSKDTLVLQSNNLINKVYAVNMNYKREIDLSVKNHNVEIPLNSLSKGKHVFVAVQSPMRIVFVVKILGDDETLLALEESDDFMSKK